MEIIKSIFFILTAAILIYLLIYYVTDVESKRKYKWYEHFLILFSALTFIICLGTGIMIFIISMEGKEKPENTYLYQQGYKAGINTQFEQRIDTVYIKKH